MHPTGRCAILLLLVAVAAAGEAEPSGAATTVFGRLHLLILHFPIALLIAALAVDALRRRGRCAAPSDATFLMVGLGTVSAVAATATGLVHHEVEGLHNDLIERHELLGLIATGLALVATGLCWRARRSATAACDWSFRAVLVACVVVLGLGAHTGGESVHGEGFLTAGLDGGAPAATPIAVEAPAPPAVAAIAAIDFDREIRPLLENLCIECHGAKKQKGKLRLDTREAALTGGNGGAAIVPGDGANSLLVLRSNPPGVEGEDLMPLKKDPLTPEQVDVLIRWIDAGAAWGAAPLQAVAPAPPTAPSP
ncbi:MAG TPA: c-type cytochrome domain-containing protein [Planctomycetota bacterium]|nr:c-type cytochrome domain-containing protein [Planctomycetota bacterium]